MKRVRLITFAWGESYIGELLEFALPALLAPGNLPALAAEFPCELVFLTERRLFEQVERHPSWQRVRAICPVRLIEIDDLLAAPLYGLALTYASYRAFEDLGEAVTETSLLFFNSDWILADGSYRSLIPHIRAGRGLVVSPSYCVVSERAAPILQARIAQGAGVLAMPHREMAGLVLRHRHNVIRAKTVNHRVFHMDVTDQLYWRVDGRTLLGHQLPIAIVCMTPERFVAKPEAFWDYGTVSELCPNTAPVVMGDSDDFLMLELRSEETYAEGLRPGWPGLEAIGDQLATFATKDHLDYGRHQLCLHAGPLPENLGDASARLRDALERVYARIPAPRDHRSHAFWWPQVRLFDIVRREYQARDVVPQWRWGFRASPYTNILKAEIERIDRQIERSPAPHAEVDRLLHSLGACVGQLEGLFGGDANALRKALQVRTRQWHEAADAQTARPSAASPVAYGVGAAPAPAAARRVLGWMREHLNSPHRLHPDRLVAADLMRAVGAARGKALVICSAGHDLAARTLKRAGCEVWVISAESAVAARLGQGWNMVVCDFALGDIEKFKPTLKRLLPVLDDGAKVALFHPARRGALQLDARAILNAFPPTDSLEVRYAGSRWTHLATGVYDRAVRVLPRMPIAGVNVTPIAAMAAAVPLVVLASLHDRFWGRRDPEQLPPSCASMLLRFPLDREVREELRDW